MPEPVRVLVVDDSAFFRRLVIEVLEQDPGLTVVGYARNGMEALARIPQLRPQVVTLDVEMPVMDGLATCAEIMKRFPLPVIMLSALTREGAEAALKALELGAVDFIAKPQGREAMAELAEHLPARVKAVAGVPLRHLQGRPLPGVPTSWPRAVPPPVPRGRIELVAIGASTGGPRALHQVLPGLAHGFPCPVLVAKHMPLGFTAPLADRLDQVAHLRVREASQGQELTAGMVLVAPAGWQTLVYKSKGVLRVSLEHHEAARFKPCIDVLMESVAEACGPASLGVIFTGMGSDGAKGLAAIRRRGGRTLAEDEASCVVFGMPRAARIAGAVERMVPLEKMALEINRLVGVEV